MGQAASGNSFWSTLTTHLRADPRKTALLAVLTVAMLIVWGRLVARGRAAPAAAPAAAVAAELLETPVADAAAPEAATPSESSHPAGGPSILRREAVAAAAAVELSAPEPVSVIASPRKLVRDLFAGGDRILVRDQREEDPERQDATPAGIWQRLRTVAREERTRFHEREAAVRRAAEGLTVQSTIIGHPSSAVINGRSVRRGDRLGGFEVVEIEARRVIVRKDGIRVPLVMP